MLEILIQSWTRSLEAIEYDLLGLGSIILKLRNENDRGHLICTEVWFRNVMDRFSITIGIRGEATGNMERVEEKEKRMEGHLLIQLYKNYKKKRINLKYDIRMKKSLYLSHQRSLSKWIFKSKYFGGQQPDGSMV